MTYRSRLQRLRENQQTQLDLADEYLWEHLEAYAKAYDESKEAQEAFLLAAREHNAGKIDMNAWQSKQAIFEGKADVRDRAALALAEALFDVL